MRRIAVIAAAGALALSLAGCSAGSQDEIPTFDEYLSEQGICTQDEYEEYLDDTAAVRDEMYYYLENGSAMLEDEQATEDMISRLDAAIEDGNLVNPPAGLEDAHEYLMSAASKLSEALNYSLIAIQSTDIDLATEAIRMYSYTLDEVTDMIDKSTEEFNEAAQRLDEATDEYMELKNQQ